MAGLDDLNEISQGVPKTTEQQITVNDVNDHNFGMTPEQMNLFNSYQQQQPTTNPLPWKLNSNDYYPGYHQGPIGQGSDMFGSFSTYGPMGALVPQGVFDARDQAIHNAAFEKAKNVDAFKKQMNKLYLSKLTNINDHLANSQIDFAKKSWDKAMKAAGNKPAIATEMLKNDPEYHKGLASFENAAKIGDAVSTKMAEIDSEAKAGKFVTPSLKAAMHRLATSLDPTSPDFKNAANNFATMNAEHDFAKLLDDVTKKAFASETGKSGIDTNNPEFLTEWSNSKKEWSQDQKDQIAKVIGNYYQGSDYFTPERIKSMVDNSLTGTSTTSKRDAVLKHEDNTDGGVTVDDIMKPEEKGSFNGKIIDKNTKAPVDTEYELTDGVTLKNPVKIILPLGKFFDPQTGKFVEAGGNVEATVGGIYNVPVLNYGKSKLDEIPLDKKVHSKYPEGAKYKSLVSVQYTTKKAPAEGQTEVEETHSVWVPLETVKNAIAGKKGQNKPVLDEIAKRANDRNAGGQPTPSAQPDKVESKAGGSVTFYTIKGKQYSKESVEKKASEYGMTPEQYIIEASK